jgi:signal transduction histidine kinase
MSTELRSTGISVIGDVSWGTHFCHFYETKQDLLDTLVPYFKAGLESNESCLWVVSDSELITVEEAKRALAQAVPDLDRHLSDENIEIVDGHDWYFENSVLSLDNVASAWDAKVKRALARGSDGLRASADTFWLAEEDLQDFCHYERRVNNWITEQAMTVMCTYPLRKSGASEIFNVLQVHQFTTARRQGEWQVIQTPESIIAKAEIRRLNDELQKTVKQTAQSPWLLRYGMSVFAVAAALMIALWMRATLGQPATPIVAMFLSAVMLSAWFGGAGPGVVAIVLSLLAIAFCFATPIYSVAVDVREIPRLLVFTLSAVFVGFLSGAQRSKAESLRRARDVLKGTVQELERTNESLHAGITRRKRVEEALDERLRFETLLTELSAAFANLLPSEVDRNIDKWLQTLVEFLGVDRASFLQFEEGWTTVHRTHSYTVPGIEPLPPAPIGLNIQFPWVTGQLRRGVTVKWSRIPEDMPEEAVKEREYATMLGVKSGLNIPVRVGGSVIGAITFTSIANYRDWPDAMVARLRLVGEIFAAGVERKRAEEHLKATGEQLRALSGSVQAAREEEATRIAREIHDELGGSLTSLKWDLEDIDAPVLETEDRPDLKEQRKKILSMVRLIDATINTVRRIASELRPIGLDDLGLVTAIELHARKFQDRTGIIVECDCAVQNLKLSQDESTAIFRIFQEALTNILRHAQATRVTIETIEEDGEFILTIEDNGRGITDDERSGNHTLGLLGMRERAHLIGGTIDITGSAGKGSVVTLRISTSGEAGTEKSK